MSNKKPSVASLSYDEFMALQAGDIVRTENNDWNVFLDTEKHGDIPKNLFTLSTPEKGEWVHFYQKNNQIVNDLGHVVPEFNGPKCVVIKKPAPWVM